MNSAVAAEVAGVLAGAAQVYVGVSTPRGPHVTPELFAVNGRRIVCMTAAPTVKSRRLRGVPHVACAARNGALSVSMVGKATVIDPASPATFLRAPRRAASASLDATLFTVGNLAELSGAAMDLLADRLGQPIPPHRVVIILEPQAASITDEMTVRCESGWAELSGYAHDPASPVGRAGRRRSPPTLPDFAPLPDGLATLTSAGETMVGWTRIDGTPLTLPAAWDHRSSAATVPAELFRLTGAARTSAACVTFDTWSGYGPSGKQGLMLRGTGRAVGSGAMVELRCTLNRATYWLGTTTDTVAL